LESYVYVFSQHNALLHQHMSAGGPIQLVALAGSNNSTQLLCLPVSCFHIKGNKPSYRV